MYWLLAVCISVPIPHGHIRTLTRGLKHLFKFINSSRSTLTRRVAPAKRSRSRATRVLRFAGTPSTQSDAHKYHHHQHHLFCAFQKYWPLENKTTLCSRARSRVVVIVIARRRRHAQRNVFMCHTHACDTFNTLSHSTLSHTSTHHLFDSRYSPPSTLFASAIARTTGDVAVQRHTLTASECSP